ncbi:hypothetical protein J6590_048914 [Homalodisca vitripennis]|nr:hypothetical protein J6590_048914 [Homalodisca vitripennis]
MAPYSHRRCPELWYDTSEGDKALPLLAQTLGTVENVDDSRDRNTVDTWDYSHTSGTHIYKRLTVLTIVDKHLAHTDTACRAAPRTHRPSCCVITLGVQ